MNNETLNQLKEILLKHPMVKEVEVQDDGSLGVWTNENPDTLTADTPFYIVIGPLLDQLDLDIINNDCEGFYNEYVISEK